YYKSRRQGGNYWSPISDKLHRDNDEALQVRFVALPEECELKCDKANCHLEHYQVTSSSTPSNTSELYISFPNEPDVKVNYVPKMDFWEYVTLLSSVFGLWFGLSAFGFIDKIANFL